jgi:hypothetical protein
VIVAVIQAVAKVKSVAAKRVQAAVVANFFLFHQI